VKWGAVSHVGKQGKGAAAFSGLRNRPASSGKTDPPPPKNTVLFPEAMPLPDHAPGRRHRVKHSAMSGNGDPFWAPISSRRVGRMLYAGAIAGWM
jgi:hypothetical protein